MMTAVAGKLTKLRTAPGVFFAICGIVTAGVVVFAVMTGPARREASERLRTEQIAAEDSIYCEKLRMPRGTDDFALCAGYLREIRDRQADRSAHDAAGII